ncbi:MAG: TonB-dependent receptor [Ignavibacteria bacterium]|jgi:outer membrane receptor for Fe3+-dicitrate
MQKNGIILFFIVFLFYFAENKAFIQDEPEINTVNLSEEAESYTYQSVEVQAGKRAQTSLSIPVTLEMSNANLKDIIKKLSRENKINFIYEDALVDIPGISINIKDKKLYEVLAALLTPYDISYYEFDAGEIALAKLTKINKKTGAVKGFVNDTNGEALVGAHVMIVELGIGCAANKKGFFCIKNIKPGEYTFRVSYIGYEKIEEKLKIEAGKFLKMDFVLKPTSFLIGGIEVVGSSDLLPDDASTKTTITSGEIEHYQASSIKDVLDLIPGVQKTSNPGISKSAQIGLRGEVSDKFGTFGTLVIVDGTPVSNNANLQFLRATGSYMSTSAAEGVDLRTVPADNLESIEVVTGLPSVRYGDVTSGVINVKSKIGVRPTRLKIKNNPDTREGNLGGGFRVGEGALNYNLNVAQSERDIRKSGDEYTRITGQLVYSTNLYKNRLSTNSKIMFQRILDEEKTEGDLQRKVNYNRGYKISMSSWGKYSLGNDESSLDYNLFVTMRRENSMKSKLVSDYLITPDNDTLASYIGKVNTKGVEWTIGGRLEWDKVFYTGNFTHKILVGTDPQYNANTGEGMLLDTVYNYYGVESGKRSYSYDDIPGQYLISFYAEDKITSHFLCDFSLVVGFRYEMYMPYKFNLSGLWGDGDLVESHQGTFFNPRMNLMLYLSKVNQLRFSAGASSKSPPMSYIYPSEEVIPWRNPADSVNYYTRIDQTSPDLKGYRENMYEVAYDHKFFGSIGTSFSAYYKIRKNEPRSFKVPFFQTSGSGDDYTVYYVDKYSRYINIGQTETKGLEFSIRTAKIKELNMDFKITGSYNYIKYFSRGNSYSNTTDESMGEYDNYLVPGVEIDTLIGMMYPQYEKWKDYLQFNYLVRYTHPTLGLWITLRAEQLVTDRYRYQYSKPIDLDILNETQLAEYYFDRAIKSKPVKWLINFSMSKSLFEGAEVSFYVNNFLDDPAIYRYYSSLTEISESSRNPDLFYGIEFSMILDNLFDK